MRIHVVIPDDIIRRIDALVGPRNRSRYIADAVLEKLKRDELLQAAEQMAGSLADADIPGWETSEAAARWVHDLRYSVDDAEPAHASRAN
jgi:metal-responsive CopG/Arc/MetJ family transcriptional regulator